MEAVGASRTGVSDWRGAVIERRLGLGIGEEMKGSLSLGSAAPARHPWSTALNIVKNALTVLPCRTWT